jgi:hypothetical protein
MLHFILGMCCEISTQCRDGRSEAPSNPITKLGPPVLNFISR